MWWLNVGYNTGEISVISNMNLHFAHEIWLNQPLVLSIPFSRTQPEHGLQKAPHIKIKIARNHLQTQVHLPVSLEV